LSRSINSHQWNILLAISEERIEVANAVISDSEKGFSAFHDEIGDIVKDTIGTLTSEGSLSIEESQQLSQNYSERNVIVLKKFTDIKRKQLKQLNERMVEKKRHKLSQLKERHEMERSEVVNIVIQYGLILLLCVAQNDSWFGD
jgi:helix-turn-helix protein